MSRHRSTRPRPTSWASPFRILTALALALATLPFVAGSASAAAPTSIAIDGNQAGSSDDWEGLAPQPYDSHFKIIHDPVGNADTTTFNNSESDYPDWQAGSDGTASGKSDIGNVYIYDYRDANNKLVVAFAWDRAGYTGTGRYYVELNQKKDQGLVPDRMTGDRRITIGINGADLLECKFIETWNGSAWANPTSCTSIPVTVNAATITDFFSSPNDDPAGSLGANKFVETRINLTDFGATTCPVSGYQSVMVRSQEGGENGDTSALKDRATGNVDIPSDCGKIQIVKKDYATGNPVTVAGTVFSIAPDPTAGSNDAGPKYVKDNNGGPAGYLTDSDPAVGSITVLNVEPDTYTVTEVTAPSGYFLPPPGCDGSDDTDRCTTKTVGIGGTATFSFKDKKQWAAPTVSKTVSATYDASYAWAIDKDIAVDGETPDGGSATQNVPSGATATFDYAVTVTEGAQTKSNFRVTGTVSIGNTNDAAMVVTLSDVLSDSTVCTFPGATDVVAGGSLQVSVPAGGADYDYTCSPGNNAQDGSNTATITWDKGVYPQTQGDADNGGTGSANTGAKAYSFTVDKETNKTVTISDSLYDFDPDWVNTWGVGPNPETRSYSLDFTAPNGTCESHPNTATLDRPSGADLTASATATVCGGTNLDVTKNVVVGLTRTYAFDIRKDVVGDSTVDVDPQTGKATVDYSVVVTDGDYTDSDWTMSGQISVTNPNDWDVTLGSITDSYEGIVCDVDEGADLVIPGDGKRVFDYTCLFDSKPPYDGTNTATILWDKEDAHTSNGSDTGTADVAADDWSLTKVNETVTLLDDKTVPGNEVELGTVTWQQSGHEHPAFTYSLELDGTPGQCVDYDNTAWVHETGAGDDASVTVCYPVDPTVAKTAGGTYDRTYLWDIVKEADRTSVETDGTSATVNYTVTATPAGYTDSGWTMNGTITVSNPNDYKSVTVDITDVPNVGDGVTCTVTDGEDVVVPAGQLVDGQIVPGTATRDYICDVPEEPLYQGGTNTAVISWDGGSAASDPVEVVFALAGETNKTVTVVDDQTVPGNEVELGQATWTEEGTPVEFTYSLDLEAAANECQTYTNTAEIVETAQTADATVEACGPEILPEEEVRPRPPVVKGVEEILPATGGPQLGIAWAGLGLLLSGGALLTARRLRRSES